MKNPLFWTTALLLTWGDLSAKSLYKLDQSPFASIASRSGDVLTVIVSESISTSDVGDNSKETDESAKMELKKLFFPHFKLNKGFDDSVGSGSTPGFDFGKEDSYSGKVTNKSSHAITTKLPVRIIEEVLPGQFLIRGERMFNINGKSKTMLVSGVIRQADIASDNTIKSELISDATIKIDGDIAAHDLKPGWFSSFLNKIF